MYKNLKTRCEQQAKVFAQVYLKGKEPSVREMKELAEKFARIGIHREIHNPNPNMCRVWSAYNQLLNRSEYSTNQATNVNSIRTKNVFHQSNLYIL